ncbi:hypothetical protein DRP04_13690 [Archaeoglobales archaeon]|nr:MAG: hypothetical protein DRP04_13690 [Archaeoglobales archaeon]
MDSKNAFNSGSYAEALSMANRAKERAKEIIRAKEAIESAEATIAKEKGRGIDLVEAESIFSQAKKAFSLGEYSRAYELAQKARSMATDVDGDGVVNEDDFAPTVNNNYVYGGILVCAVGVSAAGYGIKRRIEQRRREVEELKDRALKIIEEILKE